MKNNLRVAERSRSYSNGKLLLTGEYVVLDGAKALAIPTLFGQDLEVVSIEEPIIHWKSLDENGKVWFDCILDAKTLKLINSSYYSLKEDIQENTAETLKSILIEAQKLNPSFLNKKNGFSVVTELTFPTNWGLGSSSTLINNIAKWANVDAYELLNKTFRGSGYDIACAKNNSPIIYQLVDHMPKVICVEFNPIFKNQLFFIHLNKKQDSRKGIERYQKNIGNINSEITEISSITDEFIKTSNIAEFEKLIQQHEQIISNIIKLKPIQQTHFPDYFGQIKSLGAWGGDFILATGNEDTPQYFIDKGFKTVIDYQQMVLK
ncbi:MAG TPA: GYDIA family GHMP kinase [Flavobacteriaceae bacterium]|nr:GYDIA family GHMP kinase [Flavobacteriaceae bacterium]HEX5743561.1 GYDIA family GHMP kinase [Flavobacteriaceae bacterium]